MCYAQNQPYPENTIAINRSHIFNTTGMTHLPCLISFRDLASEYWHSQILTLVSPLYHRNSFILLHLQQNDSKLCEGICHHLSLDFIHCISYNSNKIGTKPTGRVNLFMLYISDKFRYQNQQQKSDITITFKSFPSDLSLM